MSAAKPSSLVSTEYLAGRMTAPDIRIVDASYKMPGVTPTAEEDFRAAHIPGAVFFDIDAVSAPDTDLPHMLPDPTLFSARVRRLGLGDGNRIVLYDGSGFAGAARVWWMFRYFGHHDVAVLNGGLPKWRAEGRPLDDHQPRRRDRHFTPRIDTMLVRDKAAMLANIDRPYWQILDARPAERFTGAAAEPWPGRRSGHIPGSLNVDHRNLVDPVNLTLKPAEQLHQIFTESGLDLQKPIVTTCGSGITACVLALALSVIGRDDVAVYDGSWAEWGLDPSLPIETGPARP